MFKRKGQEVPEWGLVLAFVAALTMLSLFMFIPNMQLTMQNITNALQNSTQQNGP